MLEEAGIETFLSDDIEKVMWKKMVWNCGFNAITALTGYSVKEALSDPNTRDVIEETMHEVVAVAKKLDIDLPHTLPGKTINHTQKEGEIKTSMLIDMEKGY